MTSPEDVSFPSSVASSRHELVSTNREVADPGDKDEEGIQVAFRMRPLNQNERNHRRVWKVLPKLESITQTTPEGKPLPERIMGRTFFTFDKTFGEDSTTQQVYDSVAKGIVSSVCGGLNGTIFAYGQTSSGKTYTMQGSGTIEEGATGTGGGVFHMAAQDIFRHIHSQPNRIFLVRASFLEIYNEEVRDLLMSPTENRTVTIREDPRRGVFVQSKEEIVTDFGSLLSVLFQGEKSRAFAATAMNERSSRSHTIFRITIESREKNYDNNDKENNDGDDESSIMSGSGGAVLVSTLNLVDLAGSESVRHTGATGDRQKEGGMINTSLLTLSRVIVALGSANQSHINFRDSKLTRLLQPSLSGNARMAVICCATSSELYLEETRSTLAFASRAKLVKTRAQVNEVLDDRSIIRRLQMELAEAKRNSGGGGTERVKDLERKVATAGTAALEAKERLKFFFTRVLNNKGSLFKNDSERINNSKKRRLSDGDHKLQHTTPDKFERKIQPMTATRQIKKPSDDRISPSKELGLLRQALGVKHAMMQATKSEYAEVSRSILQNEAALILTQSSNATLQYERDLAQSVADNLVCSLDELRGKLAEMSAQYDLTVAEKDEMIAKSKMTIDELLEAQHANESKFVSLTEDKVKLEKLFSDQTACYEIKNAELICEVLKLKEAMETICQEKNDEKAENESLRKAFFALQAENAEIVRKFDSVQSERIRSAFELAETNAEKDEINRERQLDVDRIEMLQEKVDDLSNKLREERNARENITSSNANIMEQLVTAQAELEAKEMQNGDLASKLEDTELRAKQSDELRCQASEDLCIARSDIQKLQENLTSSTEEIIALKTDYESVQKSRVETTEKILEAEALLQATVEDLRLKNVQCQEILSINEQLVKENEEIRASIAVAERDLTVANDTSEMLKTHLTSLECQLSTCNAECDSLKENYDRADSDFQNAKLRILELEEDIEKLNIDNQQKSMLIQEITTAREEIESKLANIAAESVNRLCYIERLEAEILQSTDSANAAKEELRRANDSISCSNDTIHEMEMKMQGLQALKEAAEANIVKLKAENQIAIDTIDDVKVKLMQQTDKNQELETLLEGTNEQLQNLSVNHDSLKAQLAESTSTLSQANENALSAENCLRDLEEQKRNISEDLELSLVRCREFEATWNDPIIAIAELGLIIHKQHVSTRSEMADRESIRVDLQNKIDSLRTALQEVDELRNVVADLSLSKDQAELDLRQVTIRAEQLNILQHSCNQKIDDLEREQIDNRAQLRRQQDEIKSSRCELEHILNSLGKATKKIESMEKCKHDMKAEYEAELTETESRHAETQSELTSLHESMRLLNDEIKAITESKSEVQAESDEISALAATFENENNSLRKQIRELECMRDVLEQKLTDDATERERLQVAANESMEALQRSEETVKHMSVQIDVISTRNEAAELELRNLLVERNELSERLRTIELKLLETNEIAKQLESDSQAARVALEASKIELTNCQKQFDEKETACNDAMSQLQVVCNERNELSRMVDDIAEKLKTSEQRVSEQLDLNQTLGSQTTNDLNDYQNKLAQAEQALAAALAETSVLKESNENLEARRMDWQSRFDQCDKEKIGLEHSLVEVRREVQVLQENIEREQVTVSVLTMELQGVKNSLEDASTRSIALEDQLNRVNEEKECIEQELKAKQEIIDDLTNKMEEINQMLIEKNCRNDEASLEKITYPNHAKELEIQLFRAEQDLIKANDLRVDSINEQNRVKEILSKVEEELRTFKQRESASASKMESLSQELKSMEEAILVYQSTEKSVKTRLLATETKLTALSQEKESAERKLSEKTETLQETTDELIKIHDILESAKKKNNELNQRICELEDEVESKESMLAKGQAAFELERESLLSMLNKEGSRCNELQLRVQELTSMEEETDRRIQEAKDIVAGSQSDADVIKLMEDENLELKQLLSSSNKCVDDAREASRNAQHDLEHKDQVIQGLLGRISELEQELQVMNTNRSDGTDLARSYEELAGQLQQSLKDREEMEKRLLTEIASLRDSEENLKRLMGEEQRELIQEAEQALQKLRDECNAVRDTQRTCESDLHTVRQLKDELDDENRRYLQQTIQLESKISSLESDNTRLRRNSVRQESEKDVEITNLKRTLQKLKGERQASSDGLAELEQHVQSLMRENQHLSRELSAAHDMAARVNVPGLQEENSKLLRNIQDLQRELDHLNRDFEEKKLEVDSKLQERVAEMTEQLAAKDKRIAKLEKVKLTKEQVNALKQMKSDYATCKEQLKNAESEIKKLHQRMTTRPDDGPEDLQITELRFDKEALERKLRKFASHCQRLEDERLSILQALRSTKPSELDDDDISSAIIALCDRVASLEKDCDTLSKAETKFSSTRIEIDQLRDHNSSLRRQVSDYQKKVDKLVRSELELQDTVGALRKEQQELRQITERAQGNAEILENEAGRKLRYLEQENLQLMIDLKAAKKQLQNTKGELNTLRTQYVDRKDNIGSKTKDGGAFSSQKAKETDSISSYKNQRSIDKENLERNLGAVKNSTKSSHLAKRPPGLGEAFEPSNENTQDCKQS